MINPNNATDYVHEDSTTYQNNNWKELYLLRQQRKYRDPHTTRNTQRLLCTPLE
jgi:hypothetical protein